MHSLIFVRRCCREHFFFSFRWQLVVFISWNKNFTVNFRHTTMAAFKCNRVLIKAVQGHLTTFMPWLPCCTDAGVWWVWTHWIGSKSGTSQPPRRSTSVRIKVRSVELVCRILSDFLHQCAGCSMKRLKTYQTFHQSPRWVQNRTIQLLLWTLKRWECQYISKHTCWAQFFCPLPSLTYYLRQ